jgi:SAM-dependent methyltransferase
LKFSRMFGGWLGRTGERLHGLVPDWVRAWVSPCTNERGESVPGRLRPLAPCNICGGTRFKAAYGPHPLSHSGRLRKCVQCGSLAHQRVLRKMMASLRRKDFRHARCLQISTDRSIRPTWFGRYEVSVYNGKNSLDIQQIARADASYDIIVCNHVIEHVPDHRRALRELGRILSDRGFLFVSVPDPARHARTEDWGRPDPARHHHYREFGPDFADLLKQELPDLSVIEVWAVDDVTRDPDVAYVLTRNRTWYQRARRLPLKSRVHATRPLAA